MPKIINILFFSLILLLPSQLGKHFWPEWSLVSGVRVDYLAPTIYLTDVILLLLVISIFINHIASLRGVPTPGRDDAAIPTRLPRFLRSLAMTGIFYILFMILRSSRPWLAVYWLGRYLEILVAAIITSVVLTPTMGRGEGSRRDCHGPPLAGLAMTVLGAAILWSVALGATQMVLGRTTGWFWWLGERTFTAATPGVATMTVLGREVLRPYATFGHPNALGGFLAAAMMMEYGVWSMEYGIWNRRNIIWRKLVLLIGIIGVGLTGSRGAMAALGAVALFKIQNSPASPRLGRGRAKFRIKILLILGILAILGLSGISENAARFADESTTERLALVRTAGKMWKENWLTGVGPGQFLAKLPDYLPDGFYKIQPVHNVFLLGLAEFGMGVGLIWLIGLICLIWRIKQNKQVGRWLPVLAVIFVTGMVDHYWLTGQQNRMLLGIILGMMADDLKNNVQKTEYSKTVRR